LVGKEAITISLQVCTLASGSSGNAIYVGSDNKKILIDAGLSGAELNRRLAGIDLQLEDIDAVLLTHEHNDHISGAGVVARRCDIPIYASEGTWVAAEKKLGDLKATQQQILSGNGLEIGDFKINSFSTPHDAEESVGYTIACQDKKLAVATDMGEVTAEVKAEISSADLVILESNHDLEMLKIGPYPWSVKKRIMSQEGHLSNDDAADLTVDLVKQGVSRILLAHLSQDNNMPELAFLTIKNMLVAEGLEIDTDVKLDFAYQEQISKCYQLG
jgi:phosphoribosyl 1,2-cyclic phosphodiesterase